MHIQRVIIRSLNATQPRHISRNYHSLGLPIDSPKNNIIPLLRPYGLSYRLASTDSNDTPTTIDYFENEEAIQGIAEATDFASLGLGGYTPPGIVQTILDALHTNAGLPWWACIVCTTLVLRTTLFPFTIRSMRSAQRTTMVQPELTELMDKARRANVRGDTFEAEKYTMKYFALLKKHNITPMSQFINVLVQTPFFISFFLGIRGMYNAPVESLATGGILWFPNLLIPDPFFILPLSTSITMFISMQVSEMRNAMATNALLKYGIVGMSLLIFPITMKFPAALTLYWFTSNIFTTVVSLTVTSNKISPYFGLKPMRDISKMIAERPKGKSAREMFDETRMNAKSKAKLRAYENDKVKDIKESARLKNYTVMYSADQLDRLYAKNSNRTRITKYFP
ncbi:hypothetical protein LOD99_12337 [Oopsacas minuta]|uniref:Membrane insertase YidC/Oxa/ALB C-terminal domain-containing protein n=1 Tax=Oopsacas minuta TaxID=111878 RepID=A0AAV7JF06_9METZ|nr:hypothetical protein LOD99_12337 [Oopsacas minuta]